VAIVNGKKEKIFGVDHDPEDRLKMTSDKEGYPIATRDGKNITAIDFVDATQENVEKLNKGKKPSSVRLFSGFGPGTLKKPYT
jgi:arginyl-tRNA synthetase